MADQKPEGQQPPGRTPQEIEAARKLFAGSCEFVAGAASPESMIGISLPEVAFAGRSNVGKSSLVNALTGRRTLARTSSSPGHTRQINFFDLAGRLFLVDLPGYGFAQVSRSMKEAWQDLASAYLRGRPTLGAATGAAYAHVRRLVSATGRGEAPPQDLEPVRLGMDKHPTTRPMPARREDFDRRLCEMAVEMRMPILAIGGGMQLLNGRYARRFNVRYGRVGHVFQGPYNAEPVTADSHLLEASRYIVLNPVRAGLCRDAAAWPWSSYRATAGLERHPPYLCVDWVRSLFGSARAFSEFVLDGL